ncbi:Glutathione S-transferase [Tistlia consotensis]|uniref:Glutathione S-transferase n=1 Tax=Tistlia consotensis USBA 355 TaxID=560819 RepID=A0A1Y6CJ91_9PROT|nr:glutathione S-transferase N-terminal domain-containing protein [Tistlia consotensis]SMF55458.1 Glutathione S-transferase [Tistlia consotensis USBA 355]SNR88469.1 Glutathione S-transferase [Tistlia consotensis]
MRFYWNGTSPFVRKVSVVLIELGLWDAVERVQTNPRDQASGFWDRNPLAKVPAFELDDGQVLFDSPVICAWLDETHGGGRLSGTGERRWRIQTLSALADGAIEGGLLARQETMRPEGEQSPAWIDKQLAIAQRGLDRLDASVAELAGEPNLAAIGAACGIAWLGFRHSRIDWLQGRPRLAEWYAGFAERPSMTGTLPG